ncbi:MAG: hypothetical protein VKJ86_08065 [Synechococcus sp.]|nr:hypothetical protein [Synechococcus sp.]
MGEISPEQQAIAETIALLEYYSFELEDQTAALTVAQWQTQYPISWIRLAVLEALYRGRYKKISVTAILRVWQKWEVAKVQFSHEFAHLICAKLPPVELSPEPEPTVIPREESPPESVPSASALGIAAFSPPPELAHSGTYQKLKAIAIQEKSQTELQDIKKP